MSTIYNIYNFTLELRTRRLIHELSIKWDFHVDRLKISSNIDYSRINLYNVISKQYVVNLALVLGIFKLQLNDLLTLKIRKGYFRLKANLFARACGSIG